MFDIASLGAGVVLGVFALMGTVEVVSARARAKQRRVELHRELMFLRHANDTMFTQQSYHASRVAAVEHDLDELDEKVSDLDDRATSQDETDLLWEYLDTLDARLVTAEARIRLFERVQDEKLTELDTVLAAHINSGPNFISGYSEDGTPFIVVVDQEFTDE